MGRSSSTATPARPGGRLTRRIRGGWGALTRLEGRTVAGGARIGVLVAFLVVGAPAAYAAFLVTLWLQVFLDEGGSGVMEAVWDAAFVLPPLVVAVALVSLAALLGLTGAAGRIPSLIRASALAVLGLGALWLVCVAVIAVGLAVGY